MNEEKKLKYIITWNKSSYTIEESNNDIDLFKNFLLFLEHKNIKSILIERIEKVDNN